MSATAYPFFCTTASREQGIKHLSEAPRQDDGTPLPLHTSARNNLCDTPSETPGKNTVIACLCESYLIASRLLSFRLAITIFSRHD